MRKTAAIDLIAEMLSCICAVVDRVKDWLGKEQLRFIKMVGGAGEYTAN